MVNLPLWTGFLNCIRRAIKYLRYRTLLPLGLYLARAYCYIVWLSSKLYSNSVLLSLSLCWTVVRQFFGLSAHLIYLVLIVLFVAFIKSLQPRYKFLSTNDFGRDQVRFIDRQQDAKLNLQDSPKKTPNDIVTEVIIERPAENLRFRFRQIITAMCAQICDRDRKLRELCADTVTDANIQSIYKQLTWSSTRPDFETVSWLNYTLQSLWPATRTIVDKMLKETCKKRSEQKCTDQVKKKNLRFSQIKECDIKRSKPKMSVYLSCRRQLEMLRKNKERVMRKGDHYLSQKIVMVTVHLIRKFILYSKQYIIDQIRKLVEVVASRGLKSTNLGKTENLIEIDLRRFLDRQDFKLELDKRRTKSAGELSDSIDRRNHRPKIRFISAPEYGIASNSKRVISGSNLLSFDCVRRMRNKRQRLARSMNDFLFDARAAYRERHNIKKPISIQDFNLGKKAPQITAIKFLDGRDDWTSGALSRNTVHSDRESYTMRLMIEFTFKSGKEFKLQLGSVPALDRIKLTRFNLRFRLLVSINHMKFDDDKNLEIFRAVNSDRLLPAFNQIQVAFIDTPLIDWQIKQAANLHLTKSQNAKRKLMQTKRKKEASNVSPSEFLKRQLKPISIINNSYFKYLVHSALYCFQKWFQPFDISVGDKFFFKTLW